MRVVCLPDIYGLQHYIPCYCTDEFPWQKLSRMSMKCRKKGKNHPAEYLKDVMTFDIETTTDTSQDTPFGFMYHWQICIAGILVYGRTWPEFKDFIAKLSDHLSLSYSRRMVCYVHNLSFEFQFMRDMLGEKEIFAVDKRKVLKCTTLSGIEFRCSYKLTNMSLYKAGLNEKGVKFLKQKDDLDYRIYRTPSTLLTDTEFSYCMMDVYSLYWIIINRLKNEHDNLETIPLTSTAYVRRACRRATEKDPYYRDMFHANLMTESVYTLLKEAARGGDTHANRYLSGKIIHEVDSYDVQSSYPAMMCLRKFPMTKFVPYGTVETKSELEELCASKACLFRVILTNFKVKPETIMPYVSYSKTIECPKPKLDNGRVLESDYVYMTITDIDWKIIKKQYTYDDIYVDQMHIADYGYLPESLLSVVKEYFRQKTVLKGEKARAKREVRMQDFYDLDYDYMKSKNRLNGIFGMCFTDPVRDIITLLEDGTWQSEKGDIKSQLDHYNKSRNSFLVYAWGIWVTCHARAHLNRLVELTGDGTIYCDTDSSKACNVDKTRIESENEMIRKECESRGAYADYDGVRYYMGIYECETKDAPYKEFITLGAKKYCYTDEDELHLTISGVSKENGAKELGDIKNFKNGFIFTASAGNTLYYNDCKLGTISVNGENIYTGSNIGMIDSTYTIGLTKEYSELIDYNAIII